MPQKFFCWDSEGNRTERTTSYELCNGGMPKCVIFTRLFWAMTILNTQSNNTVLMKYDNTFCCFVFKYYSVLLFYFHSFLRLLIGYISLQFRFHLKREKTCLLLLARLFIFFVFCFLSFSLYLLVLLPFCGFNIFFFSSLSHSFVRCGFVC